jgi:hypothetical protein
VEQSIDQQNKKINEDYFMKNAEPLVGKHDAEVKLNQTKLAIMSKMPIFRMKSSFSLLQKFRSI